MKRLVVKKLNGLIKQEKELEEPDEDLIDDLENLRDDIKTGEADPMDAMRRASSL